MRRASGEAADMTSATDDRVSAPARAREISHEISAEERAPAQVGDSVCARGVDGAPRPAPHTPARMKRRADFVAAQRGDRRRSPFFTLQSTERADDGPPRFGLTVSKKTAKRAVRRNRIRRRLREALRLGFAAQAGAGALSADRGCDYVLVARLEAMTAPFADLRRALAAALAQSKPRLQPRTKRQTNKRQTNMRPTEQRARPPEQGAGPEPRAALETTTIGPRPPIERLSDA